MSGISNSYNYLKLQSNLVNIINSIVKKEKIPISSSDAASAQASYSIILSVINSSPIPPSNKITNADIIESMVNEVALTKIAILNTDPRVLIIKDSLSHSSLAVNIRPTNSQLDFYYPVLAPFN